MTIAGGRELGDVLPLVVIGAGPHALALAAALVDRDRRWRDELVVVDPSGRWMAAWEEQFARQEIARLRSAGVHHPHPEPTRLVGHLRRCGRAHDLHHPYDQPSTEGFSLFCRHVIERYGLAESVVPAHAVSLCQRGDLVHVLLSDASILTAERVVVATNPSTARVPPEVRLAARGSGPLRRCAHRPWRHSRQVDARRLGDLDEARIDVVGGGLTAVQLALAAHRRGAQVRLLSRRPLVARQFDVEPGWLGPRHLDGYHRASAAQRRALIDAARGGGSVPQIDLDELGDADIEVRSFPRPVVAAFDGPADEVWLATGAAQDVARDPLLRPLHTEAPTAVLGGLPVLDHDLSWPGTSVHLLGGYAALALGPASRNLWGARQGAERLGAALG